MRKAIPYALAMCMLFSLAGCASAPPTAELTGIVFERNRSLDYTDKFTLDRESGQAMYEYAVGGTNIIPGSEVDIRKEYAVTESEWAEIAAFLDACNVPKWREKYSDAGVMDGMVWAVELTYADGTVRASKGINKYPEEYEKFSAGMDALFMTDGGGNRPKPGETNHAPPESGAVPDADPWAAGNTPGNYASYIDVLEYEGEVYITISERGQKSTVLLGRDGGVLPAPLPGAEQALAGWLYYYHNETGAIKRVQPGGGEPETVLEAGHTIADWRVAGNYLYVLEDFTEGEAYIPTYGLWRRPIAGGASMFYPGNIETFALSTEYLFAVTRTEGGVLWARLDGGEMADGGIAQQLDIPAHTLFYMDGWLYYRTETEEEAGGKWWGSLWRCREDGSGAELLAERASGGFNVEGDWLYYGRQTAPKTNDNWYPPSALERKRLSTGEVQALDEIPRVRWGIALAGEWVFCRADTEAYVPGNRSFANGLWYVPKEGGTDPQILKFMEKE